MIDLNITPGNADPWLDILVNLVKQEAGNINQPVLKTSVLNASQVLLNHRVDIESLGKYGLSLFLQRLSEGNKEAAILVFIENLSTPQDLIDGMNSDANAIILAKQRRVLMEQKSLEIAEEIGMIALKALIPLLLTLLI